MKRDPAPDAPVAPDWIGTYLLPTLGLLIAIGGALRVWHGDSGIAARLDDTTLLYLGVARTLNLARDLKTFAWGDFKVELDRTRRIAVAARVTAEDAQANALGTGKPKTTREAATRSFAPGPDPDDPWAGQFGKEADANHRRLDATVTKSDDSGTPYLVDLRVRSTDPRSYPLRGNVQFFLHPTFSNDRPVVTVGPSGEARLTLRAWGAFTVGAVADDGKTRLELNLQKLPDAPQEFRDN